MTDTTGNTEAASYLSLIARILVGILFLVSGVRKLFAVGGVAAYFGKLGMPMADLMVWVAIILEIGGAVLLFIGWQTKIVSWLLMLYVVIATLMAHRFWAFDPPQFANQLNHFLKNLGVIGGLILLAVHGPGPRSLDSR
jgi:putative oxidoreductase